MSMIITNTTNKETKTHISEHRFGHVVFGTQVRFKSRPFLKSRTHEKKRLSRKFT